MKKLLLTISLVVSVSLVAVSQSTLKTYMACVGYYNEYTQKYDYENYVDANIDFTLYSDYISANDENHSLYRFLDRGKTVTFNGYKVLTIKCLDELNRSCTFNIFTFDTGSKSISIDYGGKMYLYLVKTKSYGK